MNNFSVRPATKSDQPTLIEFNQAMAWETEHKVLEFDAISRGVAAVFDDPAKGFYLVAERGTSVVGQLMITTEWSDWRNGWFWWIQSVYVHPEARRQGIFRLLFDEAKRLGKAKGNVVGLRLYVEKHNTTAQSTYLGLGMK